jgi:hypothetical protein
VLGARSGERIDHALALIDAFGKLPRRYVWPHIDHGRFLDELLDRVLHPGHVNQYTTNLCGVFSIMRIWAFDFPAEYTKLALDLYEKGEGRMIGASSRNASWIRPSSDLRHALPPNGMAHADWVIAASVRESLNHVFDYSPTEGIFSIKAWSFPGDVEREFKRLGYTRIRSKTNLVSTRGYDNLMEASQLYQSGWRVALIIDSGLLESPIRSGRTPVADHWVGLDSAIVPKLGPSVPFLHSFKVWSWAASVQVPASGQPIPLETVAQRYYGFVAGKF